MSTPLSLPASSDSGAGEPSESPFNPPPRVPRAQWCWWAHVCVIASYPLFAAVRALFNYNEGQPKLPSHVVTLLLFCAIQLLVFSAFVLLAWAFSRATKDDIWWRWRGGWRPPLWGFLYALGVQFGVAFLVFFALAVATVVLSALGLDPQRAVRFLEQNRPQTEELLRSAGGGGDALYRFLVVTVLSFVVAGGSEELWRAFMMTGILHVCPVAWAPRAREMVAVGGAALIFGLGHSYQGWMGVVLTGLLGAALGAITLRHRSVWPAILAHGFVDANTFLAATSLPAPH